MLIELLFILLCGLIFGSFITCASYRLPLGEDIVRKPSRCPACNTKLGFRDLWPVLSWTVSKGKCRHCSAKISARYPLIELITAAVFLLIYAKYGISLQAVLLMLMSVALLIMIVVDLEHTLIPDEIQWALLALGLTYDFTIGMPRETMLGGLFIGAAIGLTLHHGYRWLRHKEGLGYGDVKFLAVAGLWLGIMPIVPFLFFAGLFGTIFGLLWRALGKGQIFPFGPALAASLFLCVAFPKYPNLFLHIGEYIH